MTLWLVRSGAGGEREALALTHDLVAAAWTELPDLTDCATRPALEAVLRQSAPGQKIRALANRGGQAWSFRMAMAPGDLVVMPLKSSAAIALGRIAGDYRYRTDLPHGPLHTRPVTWVARVPRRAFDSDILLSFGAFMAVCKVERNGAEERVQALLEARGASGAVQGAGIPLPGPFWPRPELADIEERSHLMIRERIAQKFKGHNLATLVAALLEAQGYRARVSPPGADGGVDIMAGSGPLGFDAPRIVVQVKSQDSKLDVRTLRELAGVMGRFQADHGLLVGWGGFNQPVRAEAAADYFRVRLWDAGDVVAAMKEHYHLLPHAVRAEVPLKQVWTLVPNEAAVAAA